MPPAPTDDAVCDAFLTEPAQFFRQFGGKATVPDWQMPELDADFEFVISGLVQHELRVSLQQLMAEQQNHVRVVKTMMCVLGLHATAIWTGVPLRSFLDQAGIDLERAARVRFIGSDGFENNLRVTDIYDHPMDRFEPLIAFAFYDAPLPVELGFPFRLLLADRYGYKNTKWLKRIEVSDRDEPTGQYQTRGYPDAGLIEPAVWVENQRLESRVRPGPTELCGFALSGSAGVAAVEASIDAGGFEPAQLMDLASFAQSAPTLADTLQLREPERFGPAPAGVWVAFRFVFQAKAGEHELRVRVRDLAGHEVDAARLLITVA